MKALFDASIDAMISSTMKEIMSTPTRPL